MEEVPSYEVATVWIPSGELRDQRELPRTRMQFSKQAAQLKNRIHANLAKYGIQVGVKRVMGRFGLM
ncbi:MAG: hypothetical protein M1421_01450 [Candidatus Eremiobacteraeota bacterium]|nr:hypothetical protein [Candidatus Eremiobacteraeota bacterium]